MRILLVEDEDPKRNHICSVLNQIRPGVELDLAKSVRSAVDQMKAKPSNLVLLDMSLPTFDVQPGEPGGRPQGFGGIEVLRHMDRLNIVVPCIVITAYEAFPREGRQVELPALAKQLSEAHPRTFAGLIFYNASLRGWERDLAKLIDKVEITP